MSQSPSEQPQPADAAGKSGQPEGAVRQLVLVKRGQRYVFSYHPGEEAKVLESLVALVRDPNTEMTWFDAAVLSHQMGQGMVQQLGTLLGS